MSDPRIPLLPPLTAPPKDEDDLMRSVNELYSALQIIYGTFARRIEAVVMQDVIANRPDPDGSGRIFFATDTNKLYYDDGAWNLIGDGGDADTLDTHHGSYFAPASPKFFLSESPPAELANALLLQFIGGGLSVGLAGSTVTLGVAYLPISEAPGTTNFSGIAGHGVLGETLALRDVVYFKAEDSRWWKAKADASATSGPVMLAMVIEPGAAGDTRDLLYWGTYEYTGWGLTTAALYYLSTSSGGAITTTAPSTTGHIVRALGNALSATVFFFRPTVDFGEKS